MAQEYAFQSEMAEENNGIVVCFFDFVVVSFSDISMSGKKFIKLSGNVIIIFLCTGCLKTFVFKPVIILIKTFIHRPVLWKPVPENNFTIRHIRTVNQDIKLSEPVTFCRCAVHLFESERGCILSSAKR